MEPATSVSSLADDWDRLLGCDFAFLRHGFMQALEESGATTAETGWQPFHHVLRSSPQSVSGILPLFVKTHSHGEFVFDWGYAHAYEQAGGQYYPKLYCGAPFTPATGPRLLADNDDARAELAATLRRLTWQHALSSAHVAYPTAKDAAALKHEGFLERLDWQYHWHNQDYADFDAFLGALKQRKRKKIRQERKKVANAGYTFRWITGGEATEDDLQFATRMYQQTFDKKGNWAALGDRFFHLCAKRLPDQLLLIMAEKDSVPEACALFFVSDGRLFGRYWGCQTDQPMLHFETCYYQGIEYAIEHGLKAFEPGAQGLHKIARGFTPVRVATWHYFRDPGLHSAVERHLDQSRAAMDAHEQELLDMDPYR